MKKPCHNCFIKLLMNPHLKLEDTKCGKEMKRILTQKCVTCLKMV